MSEGAVGGEGAGQEVGQVTGPTGEGGGQPPGWREALGADLGAHPTFEKFSKDTDLVQLPRSLAQSYVELEKSLGTEKMPVPKDESTWAEYAKRMGVPEDPTGYELPEVELPEGFQVHEGMRDRMLKAMHEEKLAPNQVQRIYREFLSSQAEMHNEEQQAYNQQLEKSVNDLRKRWGAAADKKYDLANRAWGALTDELGDRASGLREAKLADGTVLANHPDFVEALAELGEKMNAVNLLPGDKDRRMTPTPEEASAELDKFERENRQALTDTSHPDHKEVNERWKALHQQLFSE